jgi:hypothetical protein
MKRNVKNWLKIQLRTKFKNVRRVIATKHNPEHVTVCVPQDLVGNFKLWAESQMESLGMISIANK